MVAVLPPLIDLVANEVMELDAITAARRSGGVIVILP